MDTNRRDELIRGAVGRQFSGVEAQKSAHRHLHGLSIVGESDRFA
jgi:hypothetical protein